MYLINIPYRPGEKLVCGRRLGERERERESKSYTLPHNNCGVVAVEQDGLGPECLYILPTFLMWCLLHFLPFSKCGVYIFSPHNLIVVSIRAPPPVHDKSLQSTATVRPVVNDVMLRSMTWRTNWRPGTIRWAAELTSWATRLVVLPEFMEVTDSSWDQYHFLAYIFSLGGIELFLTSL